MASKPSGCGSTQPFRSTSAPPRSVTPAARRTCPTLRSPIGGGAARRCDSKPALQMVQALEDHGALRPGLTSGGRRGHPRHDAQPAVLPRVHRRPRMDRRSSRDLAQGRASPAAARHPLLTRGVFSSLRSPSRPFRKSGPSHDPRGTGIRRRRVVVTDPTFGTWGRRADACGVSRADRSRATSSRTAGATSSPKLWSSLGSSPARMNVLMPSSTASTARRSANSRGSAESSPTLRSRRISRGIAARRLGRLVDRGVAATEVAGLHVAV